MWDKLKGYILGAVLGTIAVASIVGLSLTHTLAGIFVGWWFGTALAYFGILYAFGQHERNKKLKRGLAESDKDLLESEDQLDVQEYEKTIDIIVDNHCGKNYIERLIDKNAQEKIENRPRSVDACIIKSEKSIEEDNDIENKNYYME